MFTVKVIKAFQDMEANNLLRKVGETYELSDVSRVRTLTGENELKEKFVEILEYTKDEEHNNGPKVVIYQNYLYIIGGIETFLFNLTKHYKDRNITIICDRIELPQIIALSKYANVKVDNGSVIDCDVILLGNYNCDTILHRVKAKKIYQMIHADWEELTKIPEWSAFKWTPNPKVDGVICVSNSAASGLKNSMGVDSKVIYNILDDDYKEDEGLTFITLSRMTPEKGAYRILALAKAFKKANKKFTWFLCCSLDQIKDSQLLKEIKSIPEFIIINPDVDNKKLIKHCDYLVQLSDTESFCYSAFEALQRNVPIILTDFKEASNIVDEGENGYILKKDLSNLDVDKIFNHVPSNHYYIDRCNLDDWEKVFKGEF